MLIKSVYFLLQTAQTYVRSSKLKQFSKVDLPPQKKDKKNLLYQKNILPVKILSAIKVLKGNCFLSIERNTEGLDH